MASEREKIIAAARDHAAQLVRMAIKKKVKESAAEDFITRGFHAFDPERPFDAYAAQDWTAGQQRTADHLFEPQARPEPGASAAPGAHRPKVDYAKITSPTDRLTAWRTAQAARTQQGEHP